MTSFREDRLNENQGLDESSSRDGHRYSHFRINHLPAIGSLIWFVFIISLYYINHKPFSLNEIKSILTVVLQTGAGFLLISEGGALGRRLISLSSLAPLERLSLQSALGLGLLSIGFMVFGSLVGVKTIYAWMLVIFLGVILWRDLLLWWRDWRVICDLLRKSTLLGKALAGGIVSILFLTVITALAPPLKFDALVYHLELPRTYLTVGSFIYVPQNMFWGMPQLGEMLYTWAMALAGTQAATVLGWGFGVLALIGLLGFVAERFNLLTALVSVSSLLAGFSLAIALAWGYVDWLTILFGIVFLISLVHWRKGKKQSFLLLAGIFSGLGFGTKYSAGIMIVCGVVVLLWYSNNRYSWRIVATDFFVFIFGAGIFSLPWLIKNLIATGNPIYPLFFPAGSMDAYRIDLYQNGLPWGNWLDAVLLPFRASLIGVEMAPGYSSSIGPLLLAIGGLSGLSLLDTNKKHHSEVGIAAIISVTGLLIWAVLGRVGNYLLQSRLYYAIFPAIAVLAGGGFDNLTRLNFLGVRLWRVIGAMIAFVLWLNVFNVGSLVLQQDAPKEILGLKPKNEYLQENLGWYAIAMQAVQVLPPDSHVLMLWEPRSLYCSPKCAPDEVLDRWLRDRAVWKSPATILSSWRQASYTHLLYYRAGADFLRKNDPNYHPEDWQSFEELLSQLPTPVNFGDAYSLYSLNP